MEKGGFVTLSTCPRCNKVQTTPFCPTCGERLVKNPFIGYNLQQLVHENNDAVEAHRDIATSINHLRREHGAKLKPLEERRQKAAERCQQIKEAIDWARKNDIQHPDVRR